MEEIVIVLGNTITALGTLRACAPLKKKGYAIWLVSTHRNDNIAIRSNIPDKKILLENGLVYGLLDLAKNLSAKPVLLFTRDDEIVEISKRQEELEEYYRFLLPDAHVVETLMEKVRFSEFAESKDLPVPKTFFVRDEKDLLALESRIPFPLIVKPYLRHAVKVSNEKELQDLSRNISPENYRSMVAQEYIEGADDQLFFCFLLFNHEGELVRSMYARKLRQWPVSYGTTSLAVTVRHPALNAAVERFSATIKMRGFCSVEFKYDARNDRFLIMEPTVGRFNQQVALTVASGVNFPIAAVQLLTGYKLDDAIQKNGMLWIYESNDLFSYLRSATRYGYFRNFFKPHISVLYSPYDLNPLLYELAEMFRKKMKKLFRHV